MHTIDQSYKSTFWQRAKLAPHGSFYWHHCALPDFKYFIKTCQNTINWSRALNNGLLHPPLFYLLKRLFLSHVAYMPSWNMWKMLKHVFTNCSCTVVTLRLLFVSIFNCYKKDSIKTGPNLWLYLLFYTKETYTHCLSNFF